ncbi:MAG: site-specific integrase [Methylococcaceae bacterium]|nr:MAG: site-specific integrase [Methylococcaceae bacterium]
MAKVNFTKKSIDDFSIPSKGWQYHYDTKVRGLGIGISSTGTRTFIVYRKIEGRPERLTLGRYPDLSIEQARNKATEANAQIAKGENPNDQKREARREMTLGDLFADYIERHAKLHKKSWQHDEDQFNRYMQTWSKKKMSSIAKRDIQAIHAKVGAEHGHYAANRLLALLHTLFSKAIDWDVWQKANPVQGIQKFREKSRERFLTRDEMPLFLKALENEPNETARDYILISLLTGARQANVLAMRWDQINFKTTLWLIPETKNGTAHSIPLVDEAVALLLKRHKNRQSEWVFPGTGKTGHLMEPKKAWKRILTEAGIENLRLHDLRRTFGSWQAATGANLSVIGKSLNHKNVSTTAIYARLDTDPVRKSMEIATKAMFDAEGEA